MARRAIWRSRHGDPRTAWGWLRWEELPHGLPLFFVVLFVAFAHGGLFLGHPETLLVLPAIGLHARRSRPITDLTEQQTLPAPGPAFAVRFCKFRNGIHLGTDDGIVTFVDGWLHYAGQRTEFSLRPADIRDWDVELDGYVIRLPYDSFTVTFVEKIEMTRFRTALMVWRDFQTDGEVESVLPPNTIHASGIAHARIQMIRAISIVVASIALIIAFRFGFVVVALWESMFKAPGRSLAAMRLAREEKRNLSNQHKPAIGP